MNNKITKHQKREKDNQKDLYNNIERNKSILEKRAISIFEILILVVSIFAISYLISLSVEVVEAQSSSVRLPTYQCCSQTKSGALCEDIDSTVCNSECSSSCQPTKCEQFTECKLGCCYNEAQGTCSVNAPQAKCKNEGGIWTDNAACNLVECKRGCCILGDKTEWITEKNCQIKSASLGFDKDFRNLNEIECYALKNNQPKGACVFSKGTENACKFTTEYDCNKIFNSTFHENHLCTNKELNTICENSKQTTCVEGKDEVYYVDTCGNVANVYDASKLNEQSYWNKIVNYSEICGSEDDKASANSKTCGNCNHLLGSVCREKSVGDPKGYGNYICRDLSCEYKGKKYQNGESWCVYDRCIGDGSDPVGSRHWKYSCIEGEVRSEPCADYRNEICAQETVKNESRSFTVASCRINNWQDCIFGEGCKNGNPDCESVSIPIIPEEYLYTECSGEPGQSCDIKEDENGKGLNVKGKGDLNDWLEKDILTEGVTLESCYPKFPPGFDVTSNEGYAAGKMICNAANFECPVQFVKIKKEVKKHGLDDWDTEWEKWFCLRNCKCLGSRFVKWLHHQGCIKLGDCGTKGNFIGINTNTGYSVENTAGFANFQRFVNNEDDPPFCPPPTSKKPFYVHDRPSPDVLDFLTGGQRSESEETEEAEEPSTITTRSEEMPEWIEGVAGVGGLTLSIGVATGMLARGGIFMSGGVATGGLAGFGNVVAGAAIGAAIGYFAAQLFGYSPERTEDLVLAGAIIGLLVTVFTLIAPAAIGGPLGWAAIVIIIVLIIIVSLFFGDEKYEKTDERTLTAKFECLPSEPVSGGDDCEKCNQDPLKPCSKYRCASLGAACELINEGTGNELCVAKSKDDKKAPKIFPRKEVALGDIMYKDKNNGFEIRENTGECIPSWTAIRFGIKTDEAAICKVDSFHKGSFDEMSYYFGSNNMYKTSHDMSLVLPAVESLNINASNQINYYIRCKDRFGNKNTDEYTINLCVKQGQDNQVPGIIKTEPKNSGYLKYQAKETNLTIWVNEPADCKWDKNDESYANMQNSMSCVKDVNLAKGIITDDGAASFGLPCQTKLTNLTLDNNFYFRCKDQPWLNESDAERNTMTESYLYNIKVSSSALNVTITEPENNQEIISATSPATLTLKAETSGGATGKATCKYSFINFENASILFYNTYDTIHSQIFNSLTKGKYTIYVVCEDEAGNKATGKVKFTITIDDKSPKITRIYHQSGSLVIMTSESAECAYNRLKCNFNFENGTLMSTGDGLQHTANWNPAATYYIKCKDSFGNLPSGCSAIVRAYDLV